MNEVRAKLCADVIALLTNDERELSPDTRDLLVLEGLAVADWIDDDEEFNQIVAEILDRYQVNQAWPVGDVVAGGVLQTVSDRRDEGGRGAFSWAESIGQDPFYEILGDTSGDVHQYFKALASGENVDDYEYDRLIGPAVDRVEDAYADTADV